VSDRNPSAWRGAGVVTRASALVLLCAVPLLAACGSSPTGTDQNNALAGSGAGNAAPVAGSATSVAGSTSAAVGGHDASGAAGSALASGNAGSTVAVAGAAATAGVTGATGTAGSAGASVAGSAADGGSTGAAGSAGAAGADAAGAGGGAAGSGSSATLTWGGLDPTQREDLGKGDGSDVITIGDSWMNLGLTGIEQALDKAGTKYRHYAVAGTLLENGQIPGQYTQAKGVNPKISTVIMTGGGNDIMFSGGCNTADACLTSVKAIMAALNTLWTQMASDGVKDVIYIQYSDDAGTGPKDTRPKSVDPPAICTTGKIFCHYLATTDIVMKQLMADGIHPTADACDRIAAALLKMEADRKMRR